MADMREPPHNDWAEREVIGCLLLNPDCAADVAGELPTAAAFYGQRNARIYQAIMAILNRGGSLSMRALCETLDIEEHSPEAAEIVEMANIPLSAGAVQAASVVSDAFRRRQAIQTARRLAERAYDASESLTDSLDAEMGELYALASSGHAREAQALPDVLSEWLYEQREIALGNRRAAISTGLVTLDRYTGGGLHPSRLHVLAARPGQGKTALAVNIACAVGEAAGSGRGGALVFSLEMAARELAGRIISSRLGPSTPEDALSDGYCEAVASIGERMAMSIDHSPEPTIEAIRRKSKQMHARAPLDLVVVDYIQIVAGQGSLSENEFLGRVSRGLKLLARELDVPVLALSQLSRDIEKRPNPRPRMSDLRGSGSLEQDADQIWFIQRVDADTRVHVAKNRAGATGELSLSFDGERTLFADK